MISKSGAPLELKPLKQHMWRGGAQGVIFQTCLEDSDVLSELKAALRLSHRARTSPVSLECSHKLGSAVHTAGIPF